MHWPTMPGCPDPWCASKRQREIGQLAIEVETAQDVEARERRSRCGGAGDPPAG